MAAWWPLQLARPVWRLAAPLLEMRYLWEMPHRIDPTGFMTRLPAFRPTPPEEALARAIAAVIDSGGSDQPRPADAGPHPARAL